MMALLSRDMVTITRSGTPVYDAAGGVTDFDLQTVYTGLASVKQIKPSRNLEAAQAQLTEAISITFWRHGLPDLLANDQLHWQGKTYTLQGPALPIDKSYRLYQAMALLAS